MNGWEGSKYKSVPHKVTAFSEPVSRDAATKRQVPDPEAALMVG